MCCDEDSSSENLKQIGAFLWHPPWSRWSHQGRETMTRYLAGVLSVIAVGVLLIAYGLLSPRVGAFGSPAELNQFARPMPASESMLLRDDPSAARYAYGERYATPAQYGYGYPAPQIVEARPVRTVVTSPAPRRVALRIQEPRRNWKRTALLIGGSTAGGAGLGAVFGGKKGALIGAAIGGGASTIYESTKER